MRLLLLVHHDMRELKQRSHHLAEGFSQAGLDVYVLSKFSVNRTSKPKQPQTYKYIDLPLYFSKFPLHSNSLYSMIDKIFYKGLISFLCRILRIDVILFTHPIQSKYIESSSRIPTIFDCHDDNIEFYKEGDALRRIIKLSQNSSFGKSNCVVFSSQYLFNKYKGECTTAKVIRNGASSIVSNIVPASLKTYSGKSSINIYYLGTVADWFDWNSVNLILRSFPGARLHIIGSDGSNLPFNNRIIYHGRLEHGLALRKASEADLLIMPFLVNELIKGVDPVKIYEYIQLRRPILSVYYEEIARFTDFVTFYNSEAELESKVLVALNNSPPDEDIVRRFMTNNQWDVRIREYLNILKESC